MNEVRGVIDMVGKVGKRERSGPLFRGEKRKEVKLYEYSYQVHSCFSVDDGYVRRSQEVEVVGGHHEQSTEMWHDNAPPLRFLCRTVKEKRVREAVIDQSIARCGFDPLLESVEAICLLLRFEGCGETSAQGLYILWTI